MAKQAINVGTTANDKKGDSLRAAFQKVNANFTELYTALGLAADANLNLGAFEFTGSVLSTTDSSSITIDQAATITSNLSVGGDIVPQTANGGDLGSAAKPWKSLYVSNSTIYIGGNSLGLDNAGNLAWNGSTIAHADGEFISLDALTDINLGSPQAGDVLSYTGSYWTAATVDKLKIADGVEFTLVGGPGVANPYVTFPEANGANVLVQGNEISVFGNEVGLSSAEDGVRLAANATATNGPRREWAFGTDGSLTIPGDIKSDSNINIDINLADSTKRIWQFGEDGSLTLPAGGTILNSSGQPYVNGVSSINTSVSTSIFTDASGDYQYGTLSYDYAVNGVTSGGFSIEYSRPLVGGNVDINVGNTIVNGDLTLSGDIKSNGNINIDINLADSTLRRWQFGEDGALTFPDGTNYSGSTITLPQTTNGIPNKVSWNFSDIAVGSTTTSLEWNLLSTTFSDFIIGTSSAATPFYFNFDGSGQTLGTIDNGGIFGGGKLTFGSTAGNNAGDANAIELKATNGDVYLTSTESVKITVDANDSSARVWTFDPSGNLNVPGGIVAEYEEDFTITTSYLALGSPPGPATKTFTFAANGDLTVPELILGTDDLTLRAAAGYTTSIEAGVGGTIEIGYQGDPPANIYIGTATAGYTTTVRIASDRIRISADVPTSSKGQSGDVAGQIAFSSTHIYYCTASYDGTTDIWKRVELTGGVW